MQNLPQLLVISQEILRLHCRSAQDDEWS